MNIQVSRVSERFMTIVCGTDLAAAADQAGIAAAALAKGLGVPLKLVHVIDELGAELTEATGRDALYDPVRARVRAQAVDLAARFDIDVEPIVVPGLAHQALVQTARAAGAGLIVVAALGETRQHQWLLGSVAERVAQTSPIPVLIVRESESIEAWSRGDRPLRVAVGAELASTSRAALRWAAKLRATGPCDLHIIHVAWPPGEHVRLGIPAPMPLDRLRAEVSEALSRDLRVWVGELPGDGETSFRVSPGWGRVETHLAQLAEEAQADLLVVGTHQRAGAARVWQGSVSRGALHQAACNVACVPRGADTEEVAAIPSFRRVLVPTDFSELANRAIVLGYGLVAPGGVVHLLHVVTRRPAEHDPDPIERLRGMIPAGAAERRVATEIEVVEDEEAWRGIWHAAGRLGVDAICMATHGRSGLSQALLGSQAQRVVQLARLPVLLLPPERGA